MATSVSLQTRTAVVVRGSRRVVRMIVIAGGFILVVLVGSLVWVGI